MKRLSSAPVHESSEHEDTPLQLIVSDAVAMWTPQYQKKDAGGTFPGAMVRYL